MEGGDQTKLARIVVLEGWETAELPSEYILAHDRYSLGRDSTCDIIINGRRTSRRHAMITRDGPRYVLIDERSTNGTFVKEVRIERQKPYTLSNGDTIGLGERAAMVRFLDPNPTEVVPTMLVWDEAQQRFLLQEKKLELTMQQQRLLYYLYQKANQVCLSASCVRAVWDREYEREDDQLLQKLVSELKKKLIAIDPAAQDLIRNHRARGYQLVIVEPE